MKPPVSPIIVIWGITGDLSKRKLLPALYHLLRQDKLSTDTKVIGISRHELTSEDLLKTVELCVLEKDKVCDPAGLEKVKASLLTQQLNPESGEDFEKLKATLLSLDPERKREWLFYMSVPSSAYAPILDQLASHELNTKNARVLIEKPFGYDLKSAEELIKEVDKTFKEDQVYRIDHYLAKETAQNLLAFRLHNPIFSPLWNCEHIKKIRVRAFEKIGVEGRANFFEQTGTLRDFIQSHLMQLLAITLMDLPEDMSSQAIHAKKQDFLSGLNPADPSQAARAQYDSYPKEVGNDASFVETFAKVKLSHKAGEWEDTEMVLESGKAMDEYTTDVTVEFRTPHESQRNNLIFRLQPNEGISLDLVVKEPGLEDRMHHTALNFNYEQVFKDGDYLDAYERVLLDAVSGDQSLFASDKEVLETWRVLQPIIDVWTKNGDGLEHYKAGSRPTSAE